MEGTGCKATEHHTAVECNGCGFGECTCNVPDLPDDAFMARRDVVKRATHAHIRETGHTVRFADGVTLVPE